PHLRSSACRLPHQRLVKSTARVRVHLLRPHGGYRLGTTSDVHVLCVNAGFLKPKNERGAHADVKMMGVADYFGNAEKDAERGSLSCPSCLTSVIVLVPATTVEMGLLESATPRAEAVQLTSPAERTRTVRSSKRNRKLFIKPM